MGKEGEEFRQEMRRMVDETSSLHGKIKEEFSGIKEELGAMMRFPSPDFEKRSPPWRQGSRPWRRWYFH